MSEIKIGDKFKSKNNIGDSTIYEITDIFTASNGVTLFKIQHIKTNGISISPGIYINLLHLEELEYSYAKIESFRLHWKLMQDGVEMKKTIC